MEPRDREVITELTVGMAVLKEQLRATTETLTCLVEKIEAIQHSHTILETKTQLQEAGSRRWADPAIGVGYGVLGGGLMALGKWLLELWSGAPAKH